jgi:hypothetical protein
MPAAFPRNRAERTSAAEPVDPGEIDEGLDDGPAPREGLGAIGQLAAAVLVVAVLVLVFMGGSAVLRRVFG